MHILLSTRDEDFESLDNVEKSSYVLVSCEGVSSMDSLAWIRNII